MPKYLIVALPDYDEAAENVAPIVQYVAAQMSEGMSSGIFGPDDERVYWSIEEHEDVLQVGPPS